MYIKINTYNFHLYYPIKSIPSLQVILVMWRRPGIIKWRKVTADIWPMKFFRRFVIKTGRKKKTLPSSFFGKVWFGFAWSSTGLQQPGQGRHLRPGPDGGQRGGGRASAQERRRLARDPTGETARCPPSALAGVSQPPHGVCAAPLWRRLLIDFIRPTSEPYMNTIQ